MTWWKKKKKGILIWSNTWKKDFHPTEETHKSTPKTTQSMENLGVTSSYSCWLGDCWLKSYFTPMYNSSEGCANILGSGIRIYFRQKMVYLIVIYKNKGHFWILRISVKRLKLQVLVKTFQKQLIHGCSEDSLQQFKPSTHIVPPWMAVMDKHTT